jgi:4-hydroxybenzoate polyprenyltransferase
LNQLHHLLRAMRPKQWTKNVFVFIAVVADQKFLETGPFFSTPLGQSFLGFLLFCGMSSAVYLLNDLIDIEQDRLHPTKRERPIASGALSVSIARPVAIVLPIVCLLLGFALRTMFGLILLAYLINNIAYTFKIKHVVLLDVLSISAGFLLRVAGGVALIDVERFSPWMYVFTTLLALFLGFSKRRGEMALLRGDAQNHRAILNEYNLPFLDSMINVILGALIITYSFYTFSAPNLPENHTMMLTIPFVLYGVFRYLYLVHVRGETKAPDEVLLKDRPLQITVLLFMIMVALVFYQTQIRSLINQITGL